MNKADEWRVAFDIYRQSQDLPDFDFRLRNNNSIREDILKSIKEGICELDKLGEQEVANTGRILYNSFSGKNEYTLVNVNYNSNTGNEIIQTYVRHAESAGEEVTPVGVCQTLDLCEKLKEIYSSRKPKVFTSPSKRTRTTGDIIGRELETSVESTPELSIDSSNLESFVNGIKEDTIFVTHAPKLNSLFGKTFDNCEYKIVRRII